MFRLRARRLSRALFLCVLLASVRPTARADHAPGSERIDFTAYTLRRHEFSLGLGSAAFGILDEVTVGTHVLPWFAFPLLRAPIATGFVKLRDWFELPITFAVRGGFVYFNANALSAELSKNEASEVGFLAFPLELSASWPVHPALTQSLQLNWVHARADGVVPSDNPVDTALDGASQATSVSVSSLTELRLTRVFALTMRGTLLLAFSDIAVRAVYQRNGTQVAARLGARPERPAVVGNLIPGVHFSWAHVNLHLGIGFGTNWLPYVGVPTQFVTVVPDADFYVRF